MTSKKRVLLNGVLDFEVQKYFVQNIFETHCGYCGDYLGSYLSADANEMFLRCVELLLWSQRSTSGDFSILMQKCMDDIKKESFGEWRSSLWGSKIFCSWYFWKTFWVFRCLFRIISIEWSNRSDHRAHSATPMDANVNQRWFFKFGVQTHWGTFKKRVLVNGLPDIEVREKHYGEIFKHVVSTPGHV